MRAAARCLEGAIAEADLPLDAEGRVYHLALRPEEVAQDLLLVGDPARVELVSRRFDAVELRRSHREFVTHTGRIGNRRLSVVSTGIGTDNIDIVLTELDALANVDLVTRTPRARPTSLRLLRVGTSGGIQPDVPVGAIAVSRYAIGLDGLVGAYAVEAEPDEADLLEALHAEIGSPPASNPPYVARGDAGLVDLFASGHVVGITVTANGFFGPQGRAVRAPLRDPGRNARLRGFSYRGLRLVNYEMETSALYALGALLGHRAASVCTVIAHRGSGRFSSDPARDVERLIDRVLERLAGGEG